MPLRTREGVWGVETLLLGPAARNPALFKKPLARCCKLAGVDSSHQAHVAGQRKAPDFSGA